MIGGFEPVWQGEWGPGAYPALPGPFGQPPAFQEELCNVKRSARQQHHRFDVERLGEEIE
jgi:hypothetical protein